MTLLGDYTNVFVDNHETIANPGLENLFYELGYTPITKDLKPFHCDYMQGDVIIERKRVDDFAQSIRGRRTDKHSIWDQLNRMVNTGNPAYLIIEGNLKHYPMLRTTEKGLLGAMGSIAVRYNIHPMHVGTDCSNEEDSLREFVYLAGKIFKSHREGKAGRGRDNRVTYVDPDIPVPAQILSIVPGMDKMAVNITEELGLNDIYDVGTLSVSELKTVEGIGETKARKIVDYLNLRESQ